MHLSVLLKIDTCIYTHIYTHEKDEINKGAWASAKSMISLVFDVIVRRTAVHMRRKATRLPSNFVCSGALVGSSDRPRSMYMMCLDEVGRDSGDWEGQESEVSQD